MSLTEALRKAIQATSGVASNPHLESLRGAAEAVEAAERTDPDLTTSVAELVALATGRQFAVDAEAVNTFTQRLGEAHFYALCKRKGLSLARVPDGQANLKTPDFRLDTPQGPIYFEVKTVSVVDGARGITETLESAFRAQLDIQGQRDKGAKFASAAFDVTPYGPGRPKRPLSEARPERPLSAAINTLLEKTRGNIKQEQFANSPTFLVLDLSLLPPAIAELGVLRPVAWFDRDNAPFTGQLWMLAFGQPGMLVHNVPEFEGKAGVEGLFEKKGILDDPDFDFVAGLIAVVHPLRQAAEAWGLFRTRDLDRWGAEPRYEELFKLVGEAWNTSDDMNGWCLPRKSAEP